MNWLELLADSAALAEKLQALRTYFANDPQYLHMKPAKNAVLAVLNVGAIHDGLSGEFPTRLRCTREQEGDGDPHAGIHPMPGVENWKLGPEEDEPEHLAVQQFLFQTVCHYERAHPS